MTAWSKCDCVCVTNRGKERLDGRGRKSFCTPHCKPPTLLRLRYLLRWSLPFLAQSSSCSLTGLPFLTAVIRSFTRLLSCYAQCSAASQCSKSVIDSLWIPIPRFALKNSQPVVRTYQRTSGSKVDLTFPEPRATFYIHYMYTVLSDGVEPRQFEHQMNRHFPFRFMSQKLREGVSVLSPSCRRRLEGGS